MAVSYMTLKTSAPSRGLDMYLATTLSAAYDYIVNYRSYSKSLPHDPDESGCHTTQKTTTIWDIVEAKADAGQVLVEQVMVEAIVEDVEAVISLAGVALLPENLLQLRSALTTRPMVM